MEKLASYINMVVEEKFISLGYELRERYGYKNVFFIDEKKNDFYGNITVDSTLSRNILYLTSWDENSSLNVFKEKIFPILKNYNDAKKILEKISLFITQKKDIGFKKDDFDIYLYRIKEKNLQRLFSLSYFKKNKNKLLLTSNIGEEFEIVGYDVATLDVIDNNWYSELCNEGIEKKIIEEKYGKLNKYLLFRDLQSAEHFLHELEYTNSSEGQTMVVQICRSKETK